jgi:hypothetical protein
MDVDLFSKVKKDAARKLSEGQSYDELQLSLGVSRETLIEWIENDVDFVSALNSRFKEQDLLIRNNLADAAVTASKDINMMVKSGDMVDTTKFDMLNEVVQMYLAKRKQEKENGSHSQSQGKGQAKPPTKEGWDEIKREIFGL